MRAAALTIVATVFCVASSARAEVVTFDFRPLSILARDAAISAYMTDVYGSTVTTDGARATRERSDDTTDTFISTSLQLLNRGDFIILFEQVPIVGAQFEGHVIDATFGDDFTFLAFAGNDLVFEFSRDDGVEIFDSGWINFAEPVDRLIISDSGRKDVGIDDLAVQPVPEPATAVLLLVGGVIAAGKRRSREATPRAASFSSREATECEGATASERSRRLKAGSKPAAQESLAPPFTRGYVFSGGRCPPYRNGWTAQT